MKKILLSLGLLAGMAAAQSTVELDVIIRDFPVGHSDFEAFDADLGDAGLCAEKNDARQTALATPENGVCFTGDRYHPCSEGGTQLRYGQDNCDNNIGKRGYINGPDQTISNPCWSNPVYVTRAMVGTELNYDDCTAEQRADAVQKAYCARPVKTNNYCHNSDFDKWFSGDGYAAGKRINTTLTFDKDPSAAGYYIVQYDYNTKMNWNGNGEDNGYFPLDAFSVAGDARVFPMQSLNIWCPEYASYDLGPDCAAWKANGGPKDPNSAAITADQRGIQNKLHNYGFTMAGVAPFRYNPDNNETFQFIGDDDMWIFIDGYLVADLGGTHLAAPATLSLNEIAAWHSATYGSDWSPNSLHVINFYYADRQTDGSNLMMRMAISGLLPSSFGAPFIKKTESQGSGNDIVTTLYSSNRLNLATFDPYLNNTTAFPILVIGVKGDTLGYKLTSITGPTVETADGVVYLITGEVCLNSACTETRRLATGDRVSFNFRKYDDAIDGQHPLYLDPSADQLRGTNDRPVVLANWARNTTSLPPIIFTPILNDPSVIKPDFNVNDMFTGGQIGTMPGASNTAVYDRIRNAGGVVGGGSLASNDAKTPVSGFGSPSNSTINPTRTGEMILTVYPSSNNENWNNVSPTFGLPPKADANGIFGVVDPTAINEDGSVSFLKNGFPGESNVDGSMKVSPARCVTDDGNNVNCLSFSLDAKQPFRVNVTVYDHLGHFITQYSDGINAQEFRYITQASNYNGDESLKPESFDNGENKCVDAAYGSPDNIVENGMIRMNVNIYPFSQTGRRLGNGVYIVKVDRIDMKFDGCINVGGTSDWGENGFERNHAEMKFGWMRSSK